MSANANVSSQRTGTLLHFLPRLHPWFAQSWHEGDHRNHHAHIMLTTRTVTQDGFVAKDRSWNNRALLTDWREAWAERANTYLREKEISEIDHRTLGAQREEKLEQEREARQDGDEVTAQARAIEATALDWDPLPDIGYGDYRLIDLDQQDKRMGVKKTAICAFNMPEGQRRALVSAMTPTANILNTDTEAFLDHSG